MKDFARFVFLALLSGLALLAATRGSLPNKGGLEGDAIVGGRMYTNWMLVLDFPPPSGDHPLWQTQSSNPRSGVVTWRCVECHGWDYKGASGAYGPASEHYTGFPGLGRMVGASYDETLAWLDGTNNPNHNFSPYMAPLSMENMIAFLRTQQVDTDLMIEPLSGAALGDWEKGYVDYYKSCEGCHGPRGDAMNFGTTAAPIYVGDLAISDPWRTVHMIRFGDSARRMPASEELGWSFSRVANVLAYAQTLPRGNPDLGIPLPANEVETQGDIRPIIWAGLGIFALIILNLSWDFYRERNTPNGN